eukprot:scaffold990_cov21-Tisochrysis_lutea.AAC.1
MQWHSRYMTYYVPLFGVQCGKHNRTIDHLSIKSCSPFLGGEVIASDCTCAAVGYGGIECSVWLTSVMILRLFFRSCYLTAAELWFPMCVLAFKPHTSTICTWCSKSTVNNPSTWAATQGLVSGMCVGWMAKAWRPRRM